MAKMLDVYTIKGSRVMAKMAGMLSSANTTSVVSIITSTANSGVATFFPFSMAKNLLP